MKEYKAPKTEAIEVEVNTSVLTGSDGMGEGGEV